jgi:hypothetical protein
MRRTFSIGDGIFQAAAQSTILCARRILAGQSWIRALDCTDVVHFQFFRKFLQFFSAGLERIPFAKHAAALRANHQVDQISSGVRSECKTWRHFARGANENKRSIARFHSRKMVFDHGSPLKTNCKRGAIAVLPPGFEMRQVEAEPF